MRHPFERWPVRRRGVALAAATAATIAAEIPLAVVNGPLTNEAAPIGIVSLQLAGTQARVDEIVTSWQIDEVMHLAGFSLGLDFLLMPLYAAVVAGLCIWAAGRGWLPAAGVALAWAAWAAAGFDLLETGAQVLLLDDPLGSGELVPALVRLAAIGKFTLLGTCLLYVLTGVPRAVRRT